MKTSDKSANTAKNRGLLMGIAVGDALGTFLENQGGEARKRKLAVLRNAPELIKIGEYSDDTAMSVAILLGLFSPSTAPVEAVAKQFISWYRSNPQGIGKQTNNVIGRANQRLLVTPTLNTAQVLTEEAQSYFQANPEHSAGNGALMRTSVIALKHQHDREKCAQLVRAIAQLTHADPLSTQACVLWSEAIRQVLAGNEFRVFAGLDLLKPVEKQFWVTFLSAKKYEGEDRSAMGALAWSCRIAKEFKDFNSAMLFIAGSCTDIDTIGAITGAYFGSRFGVASIPQSWQDQVFGWPDYQKNNLQELADGVFAR